MLQPEQDYDIVKSKDRQQGFLVNIVATICYNQKMSVLKNKTNKESYT